jgi:hypothetical protein
VFSIAAVGALAVGTQAHLARDVGAGVGLAAAVVAMGLGLPPAVHAAFILLAGLALGDAFADWIAPRLREVSVLVTAAVCLTLFDIWSVRFGPARSATSGGLLERLLLDAPAADGWIRFLGISDLVVIALLAGLTARRGLGRWRALLAGLCGLLASVAQAYLTRRPAPALPAIGLCFVIAHWNVVQPDRAGWVRTAKWVSGTIALLAVITGLRLAVH